MKKKNWFLIIIILVAVLLIATVIWIYAKRIEHIESKMKVSHISIPAKLGLHIWGDVRRKMVCYPLYHSATGKVQTRYEIFIQYIKRPSIVPLTQSEIDLFKSVVVCRKPRRRQYFLYENEVSKFSAFIIKGAMRQNTVNDKSMEHTV